ncbi:ribbon-helix-helix protein, CopG family [Chroococcidiopsis sp. CCNUC1]|uniref:ribbon-helix-helix protein, CopG family n=1 Tax=Chroococcidiopsis sp. CCNUC1 TaxID=2653189 RepID=UPI000D0601A7|nr:ribbon-helix-helix protein, CopG family [Chroococcidiopsis sp. CCNUC1]PSB47540.1 DNA-binding protein [Cyanosarcina cf. burmensis CCALA 770]URD50870.1 ribbon-helix-helix protein, CopG family [Chroococcidiopsis sp. CCNUC1]
MSNTKEMVHLKLDLSPELYEKLEEIAQKIGGSKSDVLRQAIALMQIAIAAKEQGRKFGIAESEQPLSTEINIP